MDIENTKKRWKKTGNGRIEMPEHPKRAVLECIVNGLIRRDYMIIGSEVHIDIFDDRIEICSPGGMYLGWNQRPCRSCGRNLRGMRNRAK